MDGNSNTSPEPPGYRAPYLLATVGAATIYGVLTFAWDSAWAWRLAGLIAACGLASLVCHWYRHSNRFHRWGASLLAAGIAVAATPAISLLANAYAGPGTGRFELVISNSPTASIALLVAGCFLMNLDFLVHQPTKWQRWLPLGLLAAAVAACKQLYRPPDNDAPTVSVNVNGDTQVSGDHAVVNSIVQGVSDDELAAFRRLFERQLATKDRQIADRDAQLEEALKAIRRLQERAQKGSDTATNALAEARKSGDSLQVLRELKRLRTENIDAGVELDREISAVAFLRGDTEEAEEAVDRILSTTPNDVYAVAQKGWIAYRRGDLDKAQSAFELFQEIGLDDPRLQANALEKLGLIYRVRGDLDRAERAFKDCIKFHRKMVEGAIEATPKPP